MGMMRACHSKMLYYNITKHARSFPSLMNKPFCLRLMLAVLVAIAGFAAAPPAMAKQLNVVATIRPLYALVLAVGDGVLQPVQLIGGNQSAHTFQFKASDARKLQDADVVFWIGPALETTLQAPIANLAQQARVVSMMAGRELDLIELRGADASPTGFDPHIWLSTANARAMVDVIARTLIELDPDNREIYEKNTRVAKNRIKSLKRQMTKFLQPARNTPFIAQHDGFAYLVREFGLNQQGYISETLNREPGARHIAELRALISQGAVRCLFVEAQISPKLARLLASETGVRLGELDALGLGLDDSPTLYARIMQKNARALLKCLKPASTAPAAVDTNPAQ